MFLLTGLVRVLKDRCVQCGRTKVQLLENKYCPVHGVVDPPGEDEKFANQIIRDTLPQVAELNEREKEKHLIHRVRQDVNISHSRAAILVYEALQRQREVG